MLVSVYLEFDRQQIGLCRRGLESRSGAGVGDAARLQIRERSFGLLPPTSRELFKSPFAKARKTNNIDGLPNTAAQ